MGFLSAGARRKAEKEFLNSNYTFISSTKSYYFNTLAGTDRKIGDIKSQKFLNADEDGNVCQREASDNADQQWKLVSAENGYCRIVSVKNNLALTIDDVSVP